MTLPPPPRLYIQWIAEFIFLSSVNALFADHIQIYCCSLASPSCLSLLPGYPLLSLIYIKYGKELEFSHINPSVVVCHSWSTAICPMSILQSFNFINPAAPFFLVSLSSFMILPSIWLYTLLFHFPNYMLSLIISRFYILGFGSIWVL